MAKSKLNKAWLSAAVAAGVIGVLGWRYAYKPAFAISEYRTAGVGLGDVVQIVTANGQLSPLEIVEIGAQVSGNIIKLYADYNSKVTNGQLIAELDRKSVV